MAQTARTAKTPHDVKTNAASSMPPAPPRLSLRDRYSMFVGTMKMLLPALAAALILLIVAWPQFTGEEKKFRLGLADLGTDQLETLSMLNARFDGVDEQDQPFSITADVATQSRESENTIELELPKADMTMTDGTWLALTARTGEYDRETQRLFLSGAVSLFHDSGFEMLTSAATIDLGKATAKGDQPVEGHGAAGAIKAEGFAILDRGQRILFTGRSHLTLLPQGRESLQ